MIWLKEDYAVSDLFQMVKQVKKYPSQNLSLQRISVNKFALTNPEDNT